MLKVLSCVAPPALVVVRGAVHGAHAAGAAVLRVAAADVLWGHQSREDP
jgi:hypothetical protein